MAVSLSDILQRLDKVKPDGKGGHLALCPCHPDKNPSLSITEKEGKILAHCFACRASLPDVLDVLGLSERQTHSNQAVQQNVKEAVYSYAGGKLRKLKYRRPDGSKYCTWQHKDGNQWSKGRKNIAPGLYQSRHELPDTLFLVEGEKDADNLEKADVPAVSLPDGAQSKWEPSYSETLKGKSIIILPDNDRPGRAYAEMCAKNLHGVAAAVWILDLKQAWPEIPDKGDVSDLLFRFGVDTGFQMVMDLAQNTPKWTPAAEAPEEPKAPARPAFSTISAADLQEADIPPVVFVVDDLLSTGLAAISAPPKFGKSWMVLQLCLSVAMGKPFLGYRTNQGECLYLALEDTHRRLQDRMNRLLRGQRAPTGFSFAIQAPDLDNSLIDDLEEYVKQHPNVKLIVIDTLQKVRQAAARNESAYASDYRTATPLKEFADRHGLCVLLVHHLRKMKDESDPFNMMSGTNGILGSLDAAIVLTREKRTDCDTVMSVTGRDVEMQEKVITFDKESCSWRMRGSFESVQEQKERREYDSNPIVITIRKLLQLSPDHEWRGSSSDLLGMGRIYAKAALAASPQRLSNAFKTLDVLLWEYDGISHTHISNGSGAKKHCFSYISPVDDESIQDETA